MLKVDFHIAGGIGTFERNKNLRRKRGTFPVYVVFRKSPDSASRITYHASTVVWAEWRVTIADTIKRLLTDRRPTARIVESARAAYEATYDKGEDIDIDEWKYKSGVEINEIDCLLVFF